MNGSSVSLAIADGVATITLDRPDVGNAIDAALAHGLLDAALACEADGLSASWC